jgi:transposase
MKHSKGWNRERQKDLRKRELVAGRTLICSLDLAKARHAFHVLDSNRESVARGRVPHSAEGLEGLLTQLEALRQDKGCDRIVFFMEGAAHFWMPIASLLERKGYLYRLVQNCAVKHQRHVAGQSGRKNDPLDAAHIGALASALHFCFTQLPRREEWIRLRTCAHEYQELVDLMTAEKNRIHAFLETVFPGYYEIFAEPFGESSLAILRSLPHVPSADPKAFEAQVRRVFQGQSLRVKRCRAAWDYVRSNAPWGYVEARGALSERIASAAERLQLFLQQQDRLREQLVRTYREIPYARNLDSISGSSAVENGVLLGILGDPKEFDDSRTLVRLAGLDPGERSSGQYEGRTPITRAGRARLRRAAMSAAMCVLQSRRNPDFVRRFFYLQNRADQPLLALQALCACAGKYLRTVWWLCVKDMMYDPDVASQGFPPAKPKADPADQEMTLEVASGR